MDDVMDEQVLGARHQRFAGDIGEWWQPHLIVASSLVGGPIVVIVVIVPPPGRHGCAQPAPRDVVVKMPVWQSRALRRGAPVSGPRAAQGGSVASGPRLVGHSSELDAPRRNGEQAIEQAFQEARGRATAGRWPGRRGLAKE